METPEQPESLDLLPRDEALALLAELNSTYGRRILRASELLTESQRHQIAHGHALAYGCCRDAAEQLKED